MAMQISVTDAKAQLTELVRRAEAGDKIVLTRHGQPVARLVRIRAERDRKTRRDLVEAMRHAIRSHASQGLGDEEYRDFVFGGGGLPEWARLHRR
jgi:prevent-host-death family protein